MYTPARIFPMLPESLSTDLTSLGAGEDRLRSSSRRPWAWLPVDPEPRPPRPRPQPRQARVPRGRGVAGRRGQDAAALVAVPGLDDSVRLQHTIAQVLRARRLHGALDLETLEPEAVFDGGAACGLAVEARDRAHELIEDFMIAANGVVARFLAAGASRSCAASCARPSAGSASSTSPTRATSSRRARLAGADAFLPRAATPRFPDLSLTGQAARQRRVRRDPATIAGHFGLPWPSTPLHAPTAATRTSSPAPARRRSRGPAPTAGHVELALTAPEDQRRRSSGGAQVGRPPALGTASARTSDGFVTGPQGHLVRPLDPPVEGRLGRGRRPRRRDRARTPVDTDRARLHRLRRLPGYTSHPMKRSLYREYRPQTFADVVGQEHVARTLRNAVETDAVAHAYLFAGPRGTGKTTHRAHPRQGAQLRATARTADGDARRHLRHCVEIAEGALPGRLRDRRRLATPASTTSARLRDKVALRAGATAASRSTSSTRSTCSRPRRSTRCSRRSRSRRTHVVFVLATTDPHKVPETILSRCQRFDFHRPQVTDIVRLLAGIVERENARPEDDRGSPPIDIQEEALHIIARHSQGGFRDAIGTLDKLVTYAEGTITAEDVLEALGVTSSDLLFEITDIVIERRTAEALQFVQRLANEGTDYLQFIRDLLRHLRQLFLLQHLGEAASDDATLRTLSQTVELDGDLFREQLQRAGQVSPREVVHFIESLGEAQREIRDGLDPRLQLELALVKVTRPELDHTATALEERLRRLEAAATGAGLAPAAPHAAPAKAPAAAKAKPQPAAAPASEPPAGQPAAAAAPASAPATPASAAAPAVPAEEPAPQAAPEPVAAEPVAAEPVAEPAQELTVERVKRAWELILQRVQAVRVPLYGFLRDGRPHGDRRRRARRLARPSEFAGAQRRPGRQRPGARGRRGGRTRDGVSRRASRSPPARRRRRPRPRPLRPPAHSRRPRSPTSPTRSVPPQPSSTLKCCPTSPEETSMANPQYNKMMKQVQKMQADMAKMQEELANEIVEASAGGGMVTVAGHRSPRAQRASRSTPTPSTPKTSRCSRT